MTFRSIFDLNALDGSNGFTVTGINFDSLGGSVSDAGDVNGDGISDIILGAPGAAVDGAGNTGESYVIFGGRNVGSNGAFDLTSLRGRNGFSITGAARRGLSGASVSSAGDINNDGFDDVIVGAPLSADPLPFGGQSYVIFGGPSSGFSRNLSLSDLNGRNGFSITPDEANGRLGFSVSDAGDINGDGIDDLFVSAPVEGKSYVIFGDADIGRSSDLNVGDLDGSNGFLINGVGESSVSSAGDINGDGFDDIITGAPYADPDGVQNAGISSIIFGGASVGSSGSFELSDINGNNGFTVTDLDNSDGLGEAVSGIGDINNDGFDDVLIGTNRTETSYVVFGGRRVGRNGNVNGARLNGRNGFVVNGFSASGRSVSGAGDINNDGIADLFIGSSFGGAGVVFGAGDIGSSGTFELADILAADTDEGVFFSNRVRVDASGDVFLLEAANGRAVSSAGDINNDGIDDIVMANPSASGTRGTAFIVFGQQGTVTENIAPVATNDRVTGSADQTLRSNVLRNDTDDNGDSLTASLLSDVSNGALVLRENGSFAYRANDGFSGEDRFTYEVSDGNGGTDSATVTLIVESGGDNNRPPQARNDRDRVEANKSTTLTVLDNDSDPDGDSLSIASVSRPSNGRAIRRNNGTIVYRPNRGFSGRDRFTYTVSDGNGGTDEATVTLQVIPETTTNRSPIARNDRFRVASGQASVLTVLNNDRDPDGDDLRITTASKPDNGRAIERNNGTILYRPDRGFSGRDSFSYTISDGNETATAQVFVTVTDTNRSSRPAAQRDLLLGSSDITISTDALTAGGSINLRLDTDQISLAAELPETINLGQSSRSPIAEQAGGSIEMSAVNISLTTNDTLFAVEPLF